ncbi:MAG: Uma2 family endonuclease [Pseudomonadota bacterium]|nr:Uma2 family endonuclease [Pseudomonadota bacterium]
MGSSSIVVRLQPIVSLTDDQIYEFSQINRDLRIERNARGELIIMPPTGGDTGNRNAEITMQLRLWAKRDGTGSTFDSSTGFRLPDGAVRSPDAAWIPYSRLNTLTAEQRKRFIPLFPDFVIELCSPADGLNDLQAKMGEYIDNGAQLGWLIDTERRLVHVYRPHEPARELENLETVSGDPVLPGFELDLREIW